MSTIERPGIDPVWEKTRKSDYNTRAIAEQDELMGYALEHLEYYVQHGRPQPSIYDKPNRHPDWREMNAHLRRYCLYRLFDIEIKSAKEREPFDATLAVRAFAAVYLNVGICFSISRDMDFDLVPYTVLGVVIGCKAEALRLARLQLAVYRRGGYKDLTNKPVTYYPGIQFMMRILADYLKELPHVLAGESLDEPYYQVLFDHWREPNLDVLAPVCLAACDAHTHRNDLRGEFGTPYRWKRIPIEILLMFKLRLLLGLSNPTLDHPLMNTPLGKLPEEISFGEIANGPDDLIYRVRQRMMQDGYDEEAIFAKAAMELCS